MFEATFKSSNLFLGSKEYSEILVLSLSLLTEFLSIIQICTLKLYIIEAQLIFSLLCVARMHDDIGL